MKKPESPKNVLVSESGKVVDDVVVPWYHIFHKWTQWQILDTGDLYGDGFGNMTSLPTGRYVEQFRYCSVCNYSQVRKSTTS